MDSLNRYNIFPAILIGLFSVGIIYYWIIYSPTFLVTESPTGLYIVNLSGFEKRPAWFNSSVYFDVLKNGENFIGTRHFHSGDAFDISFELKFGKHKWLDDSTLRFNEGSSFGDTFDTISIVNETDDTVKFVRIHSEDAFLLFDLKPNSTKKYRNSISKGDFKGFWVEVEFYSEQVITKDKTIDLEKTEKIGGSYRIGVNNKDILISKVNH